MKTVHIELSNGGVARIDEADLGLVSARSWYFVASRGTKYAKTGKNTRMHRLILGVTDPAQIVDHIDGDGLNNTRANLRVVSASENVKNRQKSRAKNKCPGAYPESGKWLAKVCIDYKQHRLGRFDTEAEAIKAVNAFRVSMGRPPYIEASAPWGFPGQASGCSE